MGEKGTEGNRIGEKGMEGNRIGEKGTFFGRERKGEGKRINIFNIVVKKMTADFKKFLIQGNTSDIINFL